MTQPLSVTARFTLTTITILIACYAAIHAETLLPRGTLYSWWLYNTLHLTFRITLFVLATFLITAPLIITATRAPQQPRIPERYRITRIVVYTIVGLYTTFGIVLLTFVFHLAVQGLILAGLYTQPSDDQLSQLSTHEHTFCTQPHHYCHLVDTYDPSTHYVITYETSAFTMRAIELPNTTQH